QELPPTGTRQFSWITGEAFSFTNWATNQPDNMATIEDRLVMNRNGTWHDFPNAGHNADQLRRFGFIVEWPAANAPVIGNVSVAPLPVVHGSQLTIGVTGLVNVSRLYLFTRTTAGVDAPVQMRHFVQPNEIFNPIIHDVNVDRIVLRAYNAAGVWIEHESDITVVDGDILLMPPNPALVLTPTITRIGVALDWVSPTQSPLGYRIFRSTSPGTLGVPVSDRPIMMRNAFDPNVNRGQVHYYRVVPITVAESMNLVTLVVTPEQWGAPSAPVRVAIPMTMPVTNEQFHFPRPGEGATIPVGSRQFITMNIGDPVMNVNNEHTPVDPGYNTAPVIRSDRTMVPIRATVEAMGGTLSWYAPLQRVGIYAPGRTIYLRVGHTAFTVNGQTQHMDEAPFISPTYRTMVPLRFAAQSLGAEVEWIAARQRVIIVWTE
ncbi:MAG: stalk domain-containing protein, partial [Defluviitaleaceae bacterium]|nr:stalk domain-containing protein [Defluviitaleaceae bacterium]